MSGQATLIERLAQYASEQPYSAIPEEARHVARRLVFDSLGTGLGGYQRDLGRKAVRFAVEENAGAQATVLGDGRQSTLEGAAFANATMIKILGMDDSHRSASHIAAQVIPAALAVAEQHGLSGRELVRAIVVTYDLAVRVGLAVRYAQRARGLDMKGTIGTMASALVAGLCARLDAPRLAHAIALAADMSSGTEQYVYDRGRCDTKDLIAGFAARSGVFAMRLAASDFYGPRGGLDGEYGFFRAFGDGTYDPALFDDLGEHFAIVTTAFKPHGGCRHTHQAVDAVQQVLKQVQPDPADIEQVTVRTYQYALQPSFRVDPNPPSRELAGLSIRVATALALTRHSTWPDDYQYWNDPQVERLRNIVELEVDPEIQESYPNKNGCRVEIRLRGGERVEGHVEYAKGEPEFPMSDEELRAKFGALTRDLLLPERVDELYQRCMNLEAETDIGALLRLTVAEPERAQGGATTLAY